MSNAAHLLIIVANFYQDLADMLVAGAQAEIHKANGNADVITVPGALEIPGAIALAAKTKKYDGYVALGCVLRGETYHFEIVCNESARGLTQLSLDPGLAIGNGILTCETEAQAIERADPKRGNKGADAARAALKLIGLKKEWGV